MNNFNKLHLAFIGRLTPEKGTKQLIDFINLTNQLRSDVTFHIFGTGPDYQKIQKLFKQQPNIKIYGHQDFQSKIQPLLKNTIDYTYIPSQLIETFGFTALESITNQVPILAYPKYGLKQFLLPEHHLPTDQAPLAQFIKNLSKPTSIQRQTLTQIASDYSPQNYLTHLKTLLPKNTKKILLVSDFTDLIGGTEHHILKLKNLLSPHYQIQIFSFPKKKPSLLNFLSSLYNWKANRLLKKTLQNFQPDTIWCHSLHRYLGHLPLKTITHTKTFKLITIHDLGLLTDYPSATTDLGNLKNRSTFKKLLIQHPILKHLAKFNLAIVPSSFLEKTISTKLKIPTTTLKHFL